MLTQSHSRWNIVESNWVCSEIGLHFKLEGYNFSLCWRIIGSCRCQADSKDNYNCPVKFHVLIHDSIRILIHTEMAFHLLFIKCVFYLSLRQSRYNCVEYIDCFSDNVRSAFGFCSFTHSLLGGYYSKIIDYPEASYESTAALVLKNSIFGLRYYFGTLMNVFLPSPNIFCNTPLQCWFI